mmetsp:Transcript_14013/g.16974  ORF Transcript_14013/g.16974 Transcript_14013/m.16974 type:complete len:110 (+) Transcript_14013:105-434(+)|eukprot:CAMPEP_0197845546 /NCGR_PEP_ID=MMETSP1438-20131217/2466_1 /TAXON_ID=1461541 /ORGANISM="Pterosperma sp., Strain CCMP1384" /LENGTH=109 /DNA_ID=CAMNT_0043456885 /DNA_START=100 /DNA_END=429 /DNA_ORIENTATION=-
MFFQFESFVTFLGFCVLAHAAYATIQYRHELKLHGQEFEFVSSSVVVELLAGVAISFYGVLKVAGELNPILSSMTEQCPEQLDFRPDFMNVNHRSRALPVNPLTNKKQS